MSVLVYTKLFSCFQARKCTSLPVLTNPTMMRPAVMSKSVVVCGRGLLVSSSNMRMDGLVVRVSQQLAAGLTRSDPKTEMKS